jgi:hypothetical protein
MILAFSFSKNLLSLRENCDFDTTRELESYKNQVKCNNFRNHQNKKLLKFQEFFINLKIQNLK